MMFLCKVLPQAWILQNSSLDEFNLMLCDGWLDIPCACHSSNLLAPILERLVTRIAEGIFILICLIHKAMLQIIRSSCYDVISACFRTLSLSLGNHQFMSAKWFPIQRWPKRAYIKIDSTISVIFIIDKCIDNHPFIVFINRKEEWWGRCPDLHDVG